MGKKSKTIINIEYFFAVLFACFVRILPLSWAYALNRLLSFLLYLADSHHRKRSIQHLIHSGVAQTLPEARKITLKSFINMGKVCVETIKFDQYITPDNIDKHFSWTEGSREMLETKMKKSSVIFVGAHFGNWEMAGLSCSILLKPIVSVFRNFDNHKIGKYVLKKRRSFKQTIYPKERAFRPLIKAIRQEKAVGILADQHAGGSLGVKTTFFGHPAKTHISPALLHIKTNTPIVVGVSRRLDNKLHFENIIKGPFTTSSELSENEQIKDICQQFTTAIEEIIRHYPEQWVWCHRRWIDINR
ncbi:MAG: lysophospholipid acyltransferase family protein [Victivallales bacterium]|nr:lysophospholipid acyltransferase family protein [Victivallales bacterium]